MYRDRIVLSGQELMYLTQKQDGNSFRFQRKRKGISFFLTYFHMCDTWIKIKIQLITQYGMDGN